MANFAYTFAKGKFLKAGIDLSTHDIRVLLVGATSTCGSQVDAETIADFTPLGEISGTGYSRKALSSEAVNQDDVNVRNEFDAADVTWTAINAGTVTGLLLYRHVTNDSDSIPIAFFDSVFPVVTNGSDLVVQWNAEGILQL